MDDYDPYRRLTPPRLAAGLRLESDDFADGGELPAFARAVSAGGEERSPRLRWSDPPAGARSFALSVFDPDAPTGSGFWHWAVHDLPIGTRELPSGPGDAASLPAGAKVLRNELGSRRYIGAAPPDGRHRYFVVVDALDVERLEISEDVTPAILGFQRHFHTLARGILVGYADT